MTTLDYSLPAELIARYPLERRDASRLMVVERGAGAIGHRAFREIRALLAPGDLLVLNNTRVIPARLRGRKDTGGAVEFLFIERRGPGADGEKWLCMARPARGLKPGRPILLDGGVEARVAAASGGGFVELEINGEGAALLERAGRMPIPPYMEREAEAIDTKRYQTVFARVPGAVAAPTAGLHFTASLLDELAASGVEIRYLTLHTGPSTFLPLDPERPAPPASEYYSMSPEVFEAARSVKGSGRKVVAVGTTTTRALESAASGGTNGPRLEGRTDLFITPGYRFRVVDAILTNFHLPGTSLLLLAAAFAGPELLARAYKEAVEKRYRFYSYGDAMLIV